MFKALILLISTFVAFSFGFKHTATPMSRFHPNSRSALKAVTEITSVETFDATVKAAGSALVIIDYSTTWCGPCKIVLPKYVDLSEKYKDVVFLKCIGDISPEASALMKREGVRSVPAFHFWKNGSKFDTVNGARIDEVEAVILSQQKI